MTGTNSGDYAEILAVNGAPRQSPIQASSAMSRKQWHTRAEQLGP